MDASFIEQILQCGHGGEAVENHGWHRTDFNLPNLQCGHGGEAVENSMIQREMP